MFPSALNTRLSSSYLEMPLSVLSNSIPERRVAFRHSNFRDHIVVLGRFRASNEVLRNDFKLPFPQSENAFCRKRDPNRRQFDRMENLRFMQNLFRRGR